MQWRAWTAACLAAALLIGMAAADPRVSKLQQLEAAAKDKLITFDEALFTEFALSAERPYHLIVFGNSRRLLESPKLQLKKLKEEFVYTLKAFKSQPENAERVFFAELWHDDSAPVFSRLGLNALPALFHWGPTQVGKPGKKAALPDAAKCGQGITTYPWPAESIADFIKGRTFLAHGAIDRPSFIKSPVFPLFALALLGGGGYVAWVLYNSWIVRMTWIWCLGSLAIYGFSTSGGMYNIIRGMPMYIFERTGKVKWWLDQRSGQFGAEGFAMGSSYILFSGLISLMVYGLPHVRDNKVRSALSVVAAGAAGLVGKAIFAAYVFKTGMTMRSFF